jgi:hypothetical protein
MTLEKHRADLEATRRLAEEFGTLTRQQMDEFNGVGIPKWQTKVEAPAESVELARSRLARIQELAGSVKEALALGDGPENDFEAEGPPSQIFVNNQEVHFPVVSDSDSLAYRAEAIRAFLERELGEDKLIELREDVENGGEAGAGKEVQPGIVILMHHLLVLDQMILAS